MADARSELSAFMKTVWGKVMGLLAVIMMLLGVVAEGLAVVIGYYETQITRVKSWGAMTPNFHADEESRRRTEEYDNEMQKKIAIQKAAILEEVMRSPVVVAPDGRRVHSLGFAFLSWDQKWVTTPSLTTDAGKQLYNVGPQHFIEEKAP